MSTKKLSKKPYEKPLLTRLDFFEAGSAGCCKTSNATCNNTAKNNNPGKVRSSSTS